MVPYGISPSLESYVQLPSGNYFVFESIDGNVEGTTYVRIVGKNGGEIVYYSHTEWEEEGISVMGAICGAMKSKFIANPLEHPERFYKMADDVIFPKEVMEQLESA